MRTFIEVECVDGVAKYGRNNGKVKTKADALSTLNKVIEGARHRVLIDPEKIRTVEETTQRYSQSYQPTVNCNYEYAEKNLKGTQIWYSTGRTTHFSTESFDSVKKKIKAALDELKVKKT